MFKWLGGGSSDKSSNGSSSLVGKTFQINRHLVTVEDTIAEGGFAIVFVVRTTSGRRLALKRSAVNNESDLYLARQEVAITKALSDCPNSVTFLSSVIRPISPDVHEVLILLELYTGVSVIDLLNQHLSVGSRLSEREVLHIFSDVSKAVARLHHRTKPIIHRDLKIENILHDKVSDNYILCDYGSCTLKPMHPEEMGSSQCSDDISRFTTLPYRSPEMVSLFSGKTITTKSDIWALGCLLYKLCFFDTPFGENAIAIVSGEYAIPDHSPYSTHLHNLIAYLLTVDCETRPTIWQVCEVVARLQQSTNHVPNIFRSPLPPNPLPTPKGKKSKSASQSKPSISVTPAVSQRVAALSVTTTTISSRDRPRARGKSANQIADEPRGLNKSMDSGLDAFGSVPFSQEQRVGSESQLPVQDRFGATPFDRAATPPLPPNSHKPRRDLFGAQPFCNESVDSFGATPFN